MSFLFSIHYRNHDTLKRLANFDVHFTTQCQYHRSYVLCHLHTGFQFLVYHFFLILREFSQMNRNHIITSCSSDQIRIQTIGIERRNRRHQLRNCFKASIQCLISRQFILSKFTAPETFTVQTNIPVRQIVIDKVRDQTSCLSRFIFIIASIYFLD